MTTGGPAKALSCQATAGIDLTDQRALDEYRDVYHHQLAGKYRV